MGTLGVKAKSTILSLDRNEYFFPHPPRVMSALTEGVLEPGLYAPQSLHDELREGLAEGLGVSPETIVLGHGAEDLLVKMLLWQRRFVDEVFRFDFSWQTYLHFARGFDFKVTDVPLERSESGFAGSLPALAESLKRAERRAVVILNSPNNPTGHALTVEELLPLVDRFSSHIFFIDGVYDSFSSELVSLALTFPNVFFFGSFSKFFGLPGLRIGYLVGRDFPPGFQLPLGLPMSSLKGALAALGEVEWYRQNRRTMLDFATEAEALSSPLAQVFRSQAPFILAESKLGLDALSALAGEIAVAAGVRPKVFTWAGRTYLRFGLGTAEIHERISHFLALMRTVSV